MKITRRQLRRIIREEAARPFPIDYYPEEMLIQEGLWDAISNLLGSIVGFFSDAWNEAESQFDSQISGYRSDYMGSNWDSLVKTMDPEGEGDPPDMKKLVQEFKIGEILEERTPEILAQTIKEIINKDYSINLQEAKKVLNWEEEKQKLVAVLNS